MPRRRYSCNSEQQGELQKTIYFGPFVHSKSLEELEICPTGAIGVDEKGKIAWVEREAAIVSAVKKKYAGEEGWENTEIVKIKGLGFYFPGFIDTHIHASQYPNAGIFGKSTLLDWLNTYTFPMEGSFSDLERARKVYNRVVARTLSHGTTTAAYYATIHIPATNLLADICLEKGQRAFVGRVCMQQNAPDYYLDGTVENVVSKTKACIEHVKKIDPDHSLITPIITPRFAPSCNMECLTALGKIHQETGLPAQTHVAENKAEIAWVKELFPDSANYVDVYEQSGLLTSKMILAHAVHLSPEETAAIKRTDAKISHCPSSNTAITSGTAKVRQMLDQGITVGLGTDVSGGFSPSILEMARHAVWVSRHVAMSDNDAAKLSNEEVLYLATRGGAKVVGLDNQIGGFEVGMEWDAQMICLDRVEDDLEEIDEWRRGRGAELEDKGPVDLFGWESWSDRVDKWLFGGDDRNTAAVWVRGRLVHSTPRYRP